VQVCEVVDDAFSSGRVALFTLGNPGAAFDFVRVQEAAWRRYYRFPRVPTRPAGQRIRVLACAESDAPPSLPDVRDEFISHIGERGSVHFLGSRCDLRIVDPFGEVQHTRTFSRPDRYTPVANLRVLRRRDGCGFAVVVPDTAPEGSRLPPAEYRLTLTYRPGQHGDRSHQPGAA